MKVRFICDNGANIHSARKSKWFDIEDLGYPDEEWSKLSDFDKYTVADSWAQEHIEIYWEEKE